MQKLRNSADRARVEEVVKAAAEKYGTVDVVVNNAQAIVPSAPVEETSYDNMLKAWQSGVIGSLNYMQAAFPSMKEELLTSLLQQVCLVLQDS